MGFEESLIRNAAPTLAGIKTANLYNFRFKNLRECIESIHRMNKRLNQKGIYIRLMKNVRDFIEKKGEGCAYCGEWKVYHDVPAAISFFCKLKKCRDVYARVYEDGRNIYDMTVRA